MIHVGVREGEIDSAWLERARELTVQLLKLEDDEEEVDGRKRTAREKRGELMNRRASVWRELKETLLAWSYGKCWYSELRDVGSDYHVDHFRPKGRVKNDGEEEREGYWWLAFDWRNYRIAVSWCNSPHGSEEGPARGKQAQFPLKFGCMPAAGPECDLDSEIPALIDPVRQNEVVLIDFDETGLPVPAMEGWNATRVMVTRRVLHLDAERMVEARKMVWRKCKKALRSAQEALNLSEEEHRSRDDSTADRWIREVCEMCRPDAELSAVARACVRTSEYRWASALLTHPYAQLPEAA